MDAPDNPLLRSIIQGRPDLTMRAAIEAAEKQFSFYAEQHAAKVDLTGQAMEKAKVNRQYAEAMRAALEGVPPPVNEEPVLLAQVGLLDQPEPNAPAPEVMRLELVNILHSMAHLKLHRPRCEQIVDALLEKQMVYYASMSDPEVTSDEMARVAAVIEAKAVIETLIRHGAAVCDYMADKPLWQRIATRGREVVAKLEALIV